MTDSAPLIGIIMGSRSDWDTMREASATLTALDIPHECKVVSAHRTPERLYDYAKGAADRGLQCIIAGAGGAAHLPGMAASMTRLPVLGVPVQSKALDGMDSLLSIVQMPAGIWTIDNRLSMPSSAFDCTGTPSTGSRVIDAAIPGRCAAPPAPAIMHCRPRSAALFA